MSSKYFQLFFCSYFFCVLLFHFKCVCFFFFCRILVHLSIFVFLLLILTPWEFCTLVLAEGLSLKFEWQQVSSSFQDSVFYPISIVWMISTRHHISKFFSPFNNPSVHVPRAPITISTNVRFRFHRLFNSLSRSRYLSYLPTPLLGQHMT